MKERYEREIESLNSKFNKTGSELSKQHQTELEGLRKQAAEDLEQQRKQAEKLLEQTTQVIMCGLLPTNTNT